MRKIVAHNAQQSQRASKHGTVTAAGIVLVAVLLFFWPVVSGQKYFWDDYSNALCVMTPFWAKQLAGEQLPLWCSFHDGGRPLGEQVAHSAFYPPYLALVPFASSAKAAEHVFALICVAHVGWAMLGLWLLLRQMKQTPAAALLGSVLFGFSAGVVLRICSGNPIAGVSWLPWILAGITYLTQRSTLTLQTLAIAVLTGAAYGVATMVALPQWHVWMTLLCGAYALLCMAQVVRTQSGAALLRVVLLAVLAGGVSLLLSAVHVLPMLAYAAESSRAASATYREVQNHVPWRMLLTNIIPTLFGRVEGPGSSPLWNLYWGGTTPADFWAYWERTSYAGIAAVMACVLAPFWLLKTRNTRGMFFFCVALFVILFMYGIASPFQYAVVQLVPILKGFRNPVRVSFLLAFALAVLSAQLLDYVWPTVACDRRQIVRRGLGFGALMAGLVIVAAVMGARYAPDEQWQAQFSAMLRLDRAAAQDAVHAVLHSGMLTQLALVGVLVAVYIASGFGKLRGETGKWCVVVVVFVDLFLFGHKFNASVQSPVEFNAHNPISAKLKELQDTRPAAERFRFEWDPYAQANLRSVAWEVDCYNGYCMNQPMYLEQFRMAQGKNPERYRDLLNVRYRLQQLQSQEQMQRLGPTMPAWARPFAQQFGIAVEQRSNALPRVWFVPAAVVMADSNAVEYVLNAAFDPRQEVVLHPAAAMDVALFTNATTRGSAQLTAYDHARMTADSTADGPGYVVFSEWYFNGWRATVDGSAAPVLRADVVLRAVPVPAGSHTLTLDYHPREFYVGAALSSVGGVIVLTAALTWLVGWIKGRR